MKVEVDIKNSNRLINHGPVVMVTCGNRGKANIITVAWNMPVSKDPPLTAISIGTSRYSHGLISRTGEFVICIPRVSLIKQLWACGRQSGARVDKFKITGLTPSKSKRVSVPGIEECIANIECRVAGSMEAGDHTVFLGEVLRAEVDEGCMDEKGTLITAAAQTFHHLGSNRFALSGEKTLEV
jgi:flavin reductase (DIM6/NTAB) family NADH-FMN oxidoreductase RutF